MLIIDIATIGPEGLDLDTTLDAGEVHIQGEESFRLESGSIKAHVEMGDEASIHVRGHLGARLGIECARCLDPVTVPFEQNLDLFFLPHREDLASEEDEDEVELTESDLVVTYYRGGRLDLGEVIREQLFLSLPMKRLCQDACQGLCPACGANRNRTKCECVVDNTDPRLASLRNLLGSNKES
jgi:uncharacterized protein